MKKFCEICAVLGLCMALVGVVLFGAGFAGGARRFTLPTGLVVRDETGFSFMRQTVITLPGYQDEDSAVARHTVQGTVKNIRLDLGDVAVTVKTGTEYTVEAPESMKIECVLEGDTLKVTGSDMAQFTLFNWDFGKKGDGRVIITLPAEEYETINIELGTGELIMEKGISCKELRAEVGAGRMEFKEPDVSQTCILTCGRGKIEYAGRGADKILLECGMGALNVKTVDTELTDYETVVQCGMGNVKIEDRSFSGIGVDAVLNRGAAKKMDIDCGMGTIEVRK